MADTKTDTTPAVEVPAEPKATGKQASTIVSPELFAKLKEIRFDLRLDKASDLYRTALQDFVDRYEAENGTVTPSE